MPQHTTINCAALSWTLLTNGDVVSARVANLGTEAIWIQSAVGAVTPSSTLGALPLASGEIMAADLVLSQLFPGMPGCNRLYAYCQAPTKLSVSHA